MKHSIVIVLFCAGCAQLGSNSNVVPSVGTYTMTPIELENECGTSYDIEDFDSLQPTQVEVDVHVGAKQLSMTFISEYSDMYVLELDGSEAKYEEIAKQRWSNDQTFVITEKQLMSFEWSSPTISDGYAGWSIECDGDCPTSAPEFGIEIVPCTTKLFYSLEMEGAQ